MSTASSHRGLSHASFTCNADIVQRWNGTHFERSSLKSVGLRVQLGHPPGQDCLAPSKAFNDDFVVIDTDMVHEIGLDFCSCGHTLSDQVEQLLERRLFPATITNPKTAATFRCLEVFELLQYESKLTPFEFFNTLSRLTDNTGLLAVKVSALSHMPIPILKLKLSGQISRHASNGS